MGPFIRRHAVAAYYVLTFAISWSAIVAVIAARGIPVRREAFDRVLPVAIFAMLGGPSLAATILTGVCEGRRGLREIRVRLGRWRVGVGWHVLAVFIGPLMVALGVVVFAWISPGFPPTLFVADPRLQPLMTGAMSGVFVGFCEELGWTGFVLPRLRRRHSILVTGVVMGILWGAWHIASHAVLASGLYAAPFSPTVFVTVRALGLMLGPLVAFRVLMVWLYDRTGSLLVAMIAHGTYTFATIVLEPRGIAGWPLVTLDVVSTAISWAIVGAVALAFRVRAASA